MPALNLTATPPAPQDWESTVQYFKKRGAVLFVSYCRFWEKHAFVQQSLAKALTDAGVRVVWLDGFGWRKYEPTLYWNSPHLTVTQVPLLPGRRIKALSVLSEVRSAMAIRHWMKELGEGTLLWVQGGVQESIAQRLPPVDVFSTFDDPYRHAPSGALVEKSKLILCQNSYTRTRFSEADSRVHVALPPVDMSASNFSDAPPMKFPEGFPERRMGYVGSFFAKDFDFVLLENFIRSYPDWGFVLAGRTCEQGEAFIARLRAYRNFWYAPWVPRAQVAQLWASLKITLLLYRPCLDQNGAFPTKVIESLHFGIPCIATRVSKTLDLEGLVPRIQYPQDFSHAIVEALALSPERIRSISQHLSSLTDPKLYLGRVARWLQA